METEKNAFDAVRAMMLENFEMAAGATQTYVDMVEKKPNRHLHGIH